MLQPYGRCTDSGLHDTYLGENEHVAVRELMHSARDLLGRYDRVQCTITTKDGREVWRETISARSNSKSPAVAQDWEVKVRR